MKEKHCTHLKDKFGNLLYEGNRVRSWRIDECSEPDGGYWLYEIVTYHNNDWYLFCEGHEYTAIDDQPVLLKNHLSEIEIA